MEVRVTSAGYFNSMGIPLRRGRLFAETDRLGTPRVVLINESAVRQYFPHEDPIGKTIELGWGRGMGKAKAGGEVIGIVADVKDAGLNEPDLAEIFLPYRQWPISGMSVVMKTSTPPTSLAPAVRNEVHAVDPNLPVSNVRTLDEDRGDVDLAAALLHDPAGDLRGGGAGACGDRDLRRAVVRRVAAHARDRDPDGARRAGPERDRPGRPPGDGRW